MVLRVRPHPLWAELPVLARAVFLLSHTGVVRQYSLNLIAGHLFEGARRLRGLRATQRQVLEDDIAWCIQDNGGEAGAGSVHDDMGQLRKNG